MISTSGETDSLVPSGSVVGVSTSITLDRAGSAAFVTGAGSSFEGGVVDGLFFFRGEDGVTSSLNRFL